MLFSKKPEIIIEVQKPKYGKVIALTAITVAAVEAAAFVGMLIAKKISDDKIEKNPYDEGFEVNSEADDIHVEFEEAPEESNTDE